MRISDAGRKRPTREHVNIVDQVARIIDPEAFDETVWISAATGKPADFGDTERARRALHQSTAACKAVEILKLAAKTPDLKDQLVADETARWKALGCPADVLEHDDIKGLIRRKF